MMRHRASLRVFRSVLKWATVALISLGSAGWTDPTKVFQENCAECHGPDRLGGIGPALIPQTLTRIGGPKIADVILTGRADTEMPGFADQISDQEAEQLVAYLKSPLVEKPHWDAAQIAASRVLNDDYVTVDAPIWSSDPMNLTLIEEAGDHHFSVLDGDTFEVLERFKAPFAVHGSPKFTPDGRYVFIMSRDGWVQKYDLWAFAEVGRVRAGLNSRNIALSHDGKWLAVANYLPNTMTILSGDDLNVAAVLQIKDKQGTPSRVSAVYTRPMQESFILALKDVPEIWEVFYGPNPPFYGFVHDYRIEGPPAETNPFPMRRITTSEVLDNFNFDPSYEYLMAASQDGQGGAVFDLVTGHKIADLDLPGMPHLGSGVTWQMGDTTVMAIPHFKEGTISLVDVKTWETVKRIKTDGPGFFMRSHAASPYLWADVFFGPNKDVVHVIDKQSLEVVKTLRSESGGTLAHIELTRDGSHALLSIWEEDGAVIVLDARTFEEIKRLPMRKPLGKYNVGAKIAQ